ncbi:AbiJ-NTD4 domain-containing protein [Sphingomonas sp. TX0522]|uniref:AbiJ-NTD4 domain-containing protein n=1 Tax=Sphingomonas sp. TX0522 TaxID=2479205 RepID=UPI0018E02633|nr:hypothetical protein [Sphingomonas sp. TX0522]MBI0530313.1 hypothetical protein [Sphingomonas sp. TX0522]
MNGSSFSERFGFQGPEVEIRVREDAPEEIRAAVVMLGYGAGLGPGGMRDLVCEVLLKRPDPNNWSPSNIENEVHRLVDDAPWYKIYDIAERLHREIAHSDYTGTKADEYARRLTQLFREQGVGWKMEDGKIVVRGSEAFTLATQDAVATMRAAGKPTAANEIHEALSDISRRPAADVTGAIQHAMAALECVAREIDGTSDTLGRIIGRLTLPAPLDGALHKLWGFASEQGRHIQEGRDPAFEEAELVVTVASAVSVYLLRHHQRTTGSGQA